MDSPINLPGQLREHLRALRKARGLTQAALGELLGVGQARIAEIESNPGVVSVDQLMKVLSALRAGLVLRGDAVEHAAPPSKKAPVRPARVAPANNRLAAKEPAPSPYAASPKSGFTIPPKKGSW